jgi:hypothetical protein
LLLALAGAVAHAPVAVGQDTPPIEDVSAVDQYRESLPTTRGRRAVGQPGGSKAAATSLTARSKQQLERLSLRERALLERVATSSEYGAPARDVPPRKASASAKTTNADGSSSPLLLLTGLLASITAVAAALALLRRRAA